MDLRYQYIMAIDPTALEHIAELTWHHAIYECPRHKVTLAGPAPLEDTGFREEFTDLLARMLTPLVVEDEKKASK